MKVEINSDNIDGLYSRINELIDSYFSENISAISLRRYLKKGSKGMTKFIKRNELDKYESKIEKIILDVVEDRAGLEEDSINIVKTFESYNDSEIVKSPLSEYLNKINFKVDINYEKALGDFYRISLSSIRENGSIFNIRKNGDFFDTLILSEDDINKIKTIINSLIKDKILGTEVELDDFYLPSYNISKFISDITISEYFDFNDILNSLKEKLSFEYDYDYVGDYKGFFIFQKD